MASRRRSPLSPHSLLVFASVAVVLLVAAAGVAAAHGNHATATPQVSANGSVVVEEAVVAESAHLVLRADDGGSPGRVLGSRPLDRGRHTGVRVQFDSDAWDRVTGNTTVWAVLHADDGDGEFDPETDSMLLRFGEPAGDRFPLRTGDAPVTVVTAGAGDAADGIPVAATSLARPGHLAVYPAANGTDGDPLGSLSLSAGHHTDVTVPLDRRPNGSVVVAVHADDGDGEFDPTADPPVRVAGNPVASRYDPTARQSVSITTPTPGEAPGRTTTDATGGGFGVGLGFLALLALAAVVRNR
jgi:hypothetical protein